MEGNKELKDLKEVSSARVLIGLREQQVVVKIAPFYEDDLENEVMKIMKILESFYTGENGVLILNDAETTALVYVPANFARNTVVSIITTTE